MTELGAIFSQLGLGQYLDVFVTEGFETWNTVLDITESDLDALGVKLGHRRRLQREIANSRIYDADHNSPSPGADGRNGKPDEKAYPGTSDGKAPAGPVGKRKYQRHPKADKYAPERPSSAYVIFSNKIREELKTQHLTFTEIAKRVGESWQLLVSEEKEHYEMQALSAKEKYHAELIKYKKTDHYREYSEYLADFKAKNATTADGKRRRLKPEASTAKNAGGGNPDARESSPRRASASSMTHDRRDGISNPGASGSVGHALSPSGKVPITMAPPFLFGGHASPLAPRRVSPMRTMGRRDYSTTASLHVSRAHQFVEQPVDRTAGRPLSQPLSTPYEHANPRGLSQSSLESLTDPAYQSGRHDPQQHFRSSNTPVSAPSMSSNFSSSAVTPTSTYTTWGSMDDVRSQRSLPPISTVGLDPLANTAFPDSGGPPNSSSPTYLPNSHTLPPPLHSPFLSSSSSGKQHTIRNSGEGCGHVTQVTASSLANGSGTVKTPPRKERVFMNLTLADVMIDPWSDGRSASRESRETQDTLRLHPRPHLPIPAQSLSDAECSPVEEQFSNLEAFPHCEDDPLSVLAYAGRLVDRGAGYPG